MKNIFLLKLLILSLIYTNTLAQQKAKTEDDYYKIINLPVPEGIELEVGGLAVIPDGRLAACTRRGDVYMINNPYMYGNSRPAYSLFASGLHEPLGLAYIDGNLWATQRGEVTILKDNNSDGQADEYQSFYKWPLSGNYHQYSYGPVVLPNGKKLFTLNLDWIGRGASQSKWRGWMFTLDDNANFEPYATGLRSPAGFNVNKEGDIFYAENQGDWVGSGRLTHLEKGDFAGNPAGLKWSSEPNSPVKLKETDIPDTGEPLYEVAQRVPGIKPPAVWFPHTLMGISTSDILQDNSDGKFGPFAGQYFVGDQGHSKIMRMSLEKIDGVYQGACYPFREGFGSGVLRMQWGLDQSMFVGQTSRGWAATGRKEFAIERMVWSGDVPFEIKEVKSAEDGFLISFTKPIESNSALTPSSFDIQSFTYKYHHTYGSPIINQRKVKITAMALSDNKQELHVAVDSLPLGYIFSIKAEGIENELGENLLHDQAFFTLNKVNTAIKPLDLAIYAVKEQEQENGHQGHQGHGQAIPVINSAKRISTMPDDWGGEADITIELGTVPGLKFDTEHLQVKAGSKVKLVFRNNDDMLHNLLIVSPGAVDAVGQAAMEMGMEGVAKAYVPDMNEVLFHTTLLQPESNETIYFRAPEKKGNYTFVCTFPGHYTVMQGVFKVK